MWLDGWVSVCYKKTPREGGEVGECACGERGEGVHGKTGTEAKEGELQGKVEGAFQLGALKCTGRHFVCGVMMWGEASCAGLHLSGGTFRSGFEDRV